MISLQKTGGLAALVMAATYLIGFAVFFVFLDSGRPLNPIEQVAFLVDKRTELFVVTIMLYVLGGFSLLILVQTLHEHLKLNFPAMMQTVAIVGFLWSGIVITAGMIYVIGMDTVIELQRDNPARAASVWLAVHIVFEGLGGGTELLGGLWSLLISWTALQAKIFPKPLNYLGLVIGVAGILTIIPPLEELNIIFGLGQIPWFICLGIILLKENARSTK